MSNNFHNNKYKNKNISFFIIIAHVPHIIEKPVSAK